MGWLLTFFTSAIIYCVMTLFVKPRTFPYGRGNTSAEFEWLANEGREGFYDGEREGDVIYSPGTPPMTDGERVEIGEKSFKHSA